MEAGEKIAKNKKYTKTSSRPSAYSHSENAPPWRGWSTQVGNLSVATYAEM